jgi:hypothetical protein
LRAGTKALKVAESEIQRIQAFESGTEGWADVEEVGEPSVDRSDPGWRISPCRRCPGKGTFARTSRNLRNRC